MSKTKGPVKDDLRALSGAERAAIVMLALGEDHSQRIWEMMDEEEIKEAVEAASKPNLSRTEIKQLADDYARDWGLGDEAHPCDLKSSVSPTGSVRSSYVPDAEKAVSHR